MTIRRGEPWGIAVQRPAGLRIVDSDAGIGHAYVDAPTRPVGLSGGDLFRSLGSPPERTAMQHLPIDLMQVTTDGREAIAVAHVVMRKSWWHGAVTAVMNVDRISDWNVAPRAHPNDGRVDVVTVDADMSMRHRWQARTRLLTGTHVPHPLIDVRSATAHEWVFPHPTGVWIDGVRVPDAQSVSVVVRPDAFAVVI